MPGNDELGATLVEVGNDRIAVEGRVGDQRAKRQPIDERRHAHNVEVLAGQEDEADEVAQSIGRERSRVQSSPLSKHQLFPLGSKRSALITVRKYLVLHRGAIDGRADARPSRLYVNRHPPLPISRSHHAEDFTSIFFSGFIASGLLGSRIISTPFLKVASILSGSIPSGMGRRRSKEPKRRSRR